MQNDTKIEVWRFDARHKEGQDNAGIESFRERHVPIFMSVDGDYEFLAIDRRSGLVVHGVEPEFEAVSEVAGGLDGLFEQMLADGQAAALLG